jgi:ketosteroid isomerase-like protein
MPPRTNAATDKKAVRDAERALYRAMVAKDFAAIEKMLAKDHLYVHSTAVAESKARYVKELKRNLYDYKSVKSRGVKTHLNGNVAVMTGICDMAVSTAGSAVELIHLQFVLVWVKQAGRWQLLLRQATRIPG